MFYRIRVDLAFTNPGLFTGLREHALQILPMAVTINPGENNQELGSVIVEQCFHDQDPSKPCQVIEEHYTD